MDRLLKIPPVVWLVLVGALLVGLGLAGRALYQHGFDTRDAQCQAATATTTAQRTGVALAGSEAFRGAESASFSQLAGAADAFHKSFATDVAAGADADAADAGLRNTIDTTIATACGSGMPEGAAAERARAAARALGASLQECSARRAQVGRQLAESLTRHQACVDEHAGAEALNVPQLNPGPDGAKEP